MAVALSALALASALVVPAPAAAAEDAPVRPRQYQVVDLGVPPGAISSQGSAINDRGWVAGWTQFADGPVHALVWRDGEMTDLGTLVGPSGSSYATDINERGDVVGLSTGPAGGRAVLWRRGRIVDLGTLGGSWSMANGINDRGDVVGVSTTQPGPLGDVPSHAFLWRNGRMTDLGTVEGQSYSNAEAVNNRGDVVGDSGGPTVWRRGTPRLLPLLPGADPFGNAFDVNDRGDVVGYVGFASGTAINRATLWRRGVPTDLGTDEGASQAMGVNDRGQAVGWQNIGIIASRAVLWDRGMVIDLPSLTGSGGIASDINNRGEIVGISPFPNDPNMTDGHAVIWR